MPILWWPSLWCSSACNRRIASGMLTLVHHGHRFVAAYNVLQKKSKGITMADSFCIGC